MQVTNYGQGLSFHYTKAEQVPQQCLIAAKLLKSQPLFDGSGSTRHTCKVIPLDSWDDTKIFDIFNANAIKITGNKSAWHIYQFGDGTNQLYDAKGKHIQQGLHLWLYYDLERCSLETLEKAYSDVYDAMRKGWVASNPEDYQDIMVKKDPEKFAFFVKKGKISQEDKLIRFLVRKFGLEKQVDCDSAWLRKDVDFYCNDNIYMWINKEVLSEIVEKFGFEF